MPTTHASHPQVLNRLKRADGHLHNVLEMLAGDRPCVEIVQQLQAVEKAINAAKRALIHDHLDHCLDDATRGLPSGVRRQIEESKDITKYL